MLHLLSKNVMWHSDVHDIIALSITGWHTGSPQVSSCTTRISTSCDCIEIIQQFLGADVPNGWWGSDKSRMVCRSLSWKEPLFVYAAVCQHEGMMYAAACQLEGMIDVRSIVWLCPKVLGIGKWWQSQGSMWIIFSYHQVWYSKMQGNTLLVVQGSYVLRTTWFSPKVKRAHILNNGHPDLQWWLHL